MEITLEKIELVKDRTGVSYKEAKEALEAADGSVVDAIIDIEESIGERTKGKVSENSYRIVERIKELVKKGNVSKIVIKKDDEIVLNLPINVGILGTVIAPWAMVLGVLAAFGTKCVIEVVKEDGSIIDVSEMANETIEDVVEKGSVIVDEVKTKGADVYHSVANKTSEALNKAKKDRDVDIDFSFDGDLADLDEDEDDEEKQ
jgi:polyhydroxyalkanoate synthesis regulator phasin